MTRVQAIERARNIGEQDFWSSLRKPRKTGSDTALGEAVALGRAGERARAYRTLDEFHRKALAAEWEFLRHRIQEQQPPSPDRVQETLANTLTLAEGRQHRFGPRIDFDAPGLDADELYSFQYLGWINPVFRHFVRTEDPVARRWLIVTITRYYAARERLREGAGRDPRFCMLAMSGFQEEIFMLYGALLFTGAIPATASEALLKTMLSTGRALHAVTRRFIVHNIHTAGVFGLFFLARRMPVFVESGAWERHALRHLVRHTTGSYFADGCHMERSWGYGEATLWRLRLAYDFARRTGGMGRQERPYRNNIRKAYQWYAKTMAPGEICPGFGDGGIAHHGGIIDKALTIFPQGTDRSLGVDQTRSYLMRPSGFAILRNGHDQRSVYATLTFGDYCGWHGHFDCLSLNVWIGGTPVLDELGQFDSYAKPLDHVVRAAEAHNQVLIDGEPYDNRYDDGALDAQWFSDQRIDFFSAYHRAYRVRPSYRHRTYVASSDALVRRTVLFVKDPGYLVVMDSVRHDSSPQFNLAISGLWHAAAPYRVLGERQVRTAGQRACLMAWARGEGLKRMETSLDYTRAETSARDPAGYGERHCLRVRRWMPEEYKGCLGFITLIYPFIGKMPSASIRPLAAGGGTMFRAEALEVRTPAGRDTILLNPERLRGFSFRGVPVRQRVVVRLGDGRGNLSA